MKKTLVPIVLTFALIAIAPAAFAATQNSTLTVNASVAANCTIAATGTLDFGAYDPTSGSVKDSSTTLAVACTKNFDPIITIPLAGRSMTGAPVADTLNYELYSDSGRLAPFGATLGTGFHMGAAPDKNARNVNIYGRIAASQDVSVGTYSGTIQVTVNF